MVMVTILFVFVLNMVKQKYLKTNLILRPQGALWCLHLHINEKLLCTLETTTAPRCFERLGSDENKEKKHVDIDMFAIYRID